MPFDVAPDQPSESRIIDEMIRILGQNGENWVKGGGFGDKFCMLHAMNFARQNLRYFSNETELKILEAIAKIHGSYIYIPSFNDSPLRTFAEVLSVLQLAKQTKPSRALRRVVQEFKDNPQLLCLPQLAAIYDDKVREQRRNAVAEQIGAVVTIMIAGICIPA